MNILQFHKNIISSHRSYIQSFLNIKDPRIADFVDREINNKKLWLEPLVQFNPTFEKGTSISSLGKEQVLQYILDPQDVYGPDFPGETFRVLKEKEIRQYGEYRTKRLVMVAWDKLNS